MDAHTLFLPASRVGRWVENFGARHDGHALSVGDGALSGLGGDGSSFVAQLPFATSYDGQPDVGSFGEAVVIPELWGMLLVRKGGFAIAKLTGEQIVGSKVGQRHVQGRTKAGGQSQQRFARRRGNQARQANEAAAEHAARILDGVRIVVTGGDHAAVTEVLSDRRLASLSVVEPWLPVPDPRRSVLEGAVRDACSVRMTVVNS